MKNALKYDGVNLGLLSALFGVVPAEEKASWIRSKPNGENARRVWFLYLLSKIAREYSLEIRYWTLDVRCWVFVFIFV